VPGGDPESATNSESNTDETLIQSDVVFIDGASVPVAPSIALFGLGLLGLARVVRRR